MMDCSNTSYQMGNIVVTVAWERTENDVELSRRIAKIARECGVSEENCNLGQYYGKDYQHVTYGISGLKLGFLGQEARIRCQRFKKLVRGVFVDEKGKYFVNYDEFGL